MIRTLALLAALLAATLTAARAETPAVDGSPDQVTFGIDWRAEAAYAGYYQAIAKGIYAAHGIEVTIRQGGPQVNQAQLLLAHRLDFALASNSFLALNLVQEHLPFVAIAAMFQKDPSVLIAHPGQGDSSFTAIQGKPVMISGDTRAGWWNFLRARFGYTDAQIRPYTYNLQPFLASPSAIQQGYLMDEPYDIHQATGQWPTVLLLADAGFTSYGSLVITGKDLIARNPDLVQRFVDASIEGWYSWLYTDPTPGNRLIEQANPDMNDAVLAYGHDIMLRSGIVDSGDAAQDGIGAMDPTRWANFSGMMIQQKLYKPGLDVAAAYTLRFVNHKTGMQPAAPPQQPAPAPPPAPTHAAP